MNAEEEIELIREHLEYNPETGEISWKVARGNRACGYKVVSGSDGYLTVKVGKRTYKAHRVAWLLHYGNWPEGCIDHINLDRSDNRITNLRDSTRRENNSNVGLRVDNKSGVKGVSWKASHSRWCAQISFKGKVIYLGLYDDIEAAAEVVQKKREELHGEFARHG